jgi:hypothetical protein
MRELLESKEWFYTSGCNCGGIPRQEFQHSSFPGMIVKIYTKQLTYKATKGGRVLSKGSAGELQNYLNGLVA